MTNFLKNCFLKNAFFFQNINKINGKIFLFPFLKKPRCKNSAKKTVVSEARI
jgi:hypothetical protein